MPAAARATAEVTAPAAMKARLLVGTGAAVRVEVRYSGKMGRPQLHYRVEARTASRVVAPPNLCFESVLGAGFGTWDYLTRENAGRSSSPG